VIDKQLETLRSEKRHLSDEIETKENRLQSVCKCISASNIVRFYWYFLQMLSPLTFTKVITIIASSLVLVVNC